MNGLFIAVEGPTGVGKTTLATRLAAALRATAMYDPFDANPFLAVLSAGDKSTEALALRTELTFLALRVAQLREIAGLLAAGHAVVADWALLKQAVFAATTLSPQDTGRIAATADLWADSAPRPDVLIGLSASTAVIRDRVQRRGRAVEVGLTDAHIDALSEAFTAAYAAWDRSLVRLDAGDFDAFCDRHIKELAERIRRLPITQGRT